MTTFRMDSGFPDALVRTTEVRDLLEEKALEAADMATDLAPDDPATSAPDLPSSVFGEVAMTEHGWRARVGATDFKAGWYEEGAQGVVARPFIRPAVEAKVGPIEPHPDGEAE